MSALDPLKKLLREPLVHFLLLGAALFVLFGLVDDSEQDGPNRIVVTAGQIDRLADAWARTWRRPPTERELEGLIEEHVREEIYYREAQAMGLDRDDTIVRRRMRQKLEFLSEDLAAAGNDPTEEDLQSYLAEHIDEFLVSPRLSFRHVYFSLDERGETAYLAAEQLLAQLQAGGGEPDTTGLGDRISLPARYERVSPGEISGIFGREFAKQVVGLPTERWAGPIRSGYGLHLVRVDEKTAERTPALDDVRDAVERDWRAARRREAADAFYQGLRGRYEVIVEGR